MTKRTIIYLHSAELSQVSWIVCDDAHIEHSTLREHLANLPDLYKQNEITLLIPANDVLLVEPTLPKLNEARLLEALPFALEEKLIEDVHELHFAISHYQENGTIPVAIVAKNKMAEWLTLCKQYDIVPAKLYSTIFALPFTEKNWSASVLPEISTVRQNKYQGFSCEHANLSLLIDIALENEQPECIHLYTTLNTPTTIQTKSVAINEIHLSEQNWLEKIPGWIDPAISINLLQGPYQAKRKASETKKIWMLAGYLAVAWIGLMFFTNLVSFFILHYKSNRLESTINSIYQKNFPEAHSMVAPHERLQNKLNTLDEAANKNYFLVILAKLGKQLSQTTAIHLLSLDFRDKQLTMEVTATKFDDLDEFINTLTQQGLSIKQQNAAVVGDRVKASLLIQRSHA